MGLKPYIENVPDPPRHWTIQFSDFLVSLRQVIKQNDQLQIDHLLNDFWLCDEYMLLKSDIEGEIQ